MAYYFCSNCGEPVAGPDANFCANCGKQLHRVQTESASDEKYTIDNQRRNYDEAHNYSGTANYIEMMKSQPTIMEQSQNSHFPKARSKNNTLRNLILLCVIFIVGYCMVAGFVGGIVGGDDYVRQDKPSSTEYYNQTYKPPSAEYYYQTYIWSYGGYEYTYSLGIPGTTYDYYRNQSHKSTRFDQYALSDNDRKILNQIITNFEEIGNERGYSKDENAMNIIAFVQAIPYAYDNVTTGYEEYPRYPIETLVDGCGDCEDTAILAAALLHEMGYGVVLLEFPSHLALGIAGGENITGSYYEYNGTKYFYVETTASGWGVGKVPKEIDSSTAKIHLMKKR